MRLLRCNSYVCFVLAISAFAVFSGVSPARAQCVLVATAGNDILTCGSGTHVGDFNDLAGNNTLTFPAGGSGTVTGNVTFGAGADRVEINSGVIAGTLNQGDGIDDFIMTGGQIGALNQSGGLDTFFMSGGTIVGGFTAGDFATFTGGTIGFVNLLAADNVFDMSGGNILGNLSAGFGNDTIIISGGVIGGFISLSGGADRVTVTGGQIGAEIRTGTGGDTFIWDGGGTIGGPVQMEQGNDVATLRNLDEARLSSTPGIDGGTEADVLIFDNTTAASASRYTNWEDVSLTNGSGFALDMNFVLGDAGTGTGSFTIDGQSTLFAGNGANAAIAPFTAGQLVNVTNSGVIDLTNGPPSAADSFTVMGNYTGAGGQLHLQTRLESDGAPSDRLVISSGAATGSTGIAIVNLGGSGAQTTQDGIMVVEAINGATTGGGAFALSGPAAAGAYEYLLFKGGVAAGTAENWYLRSTLLVAPAAGAPPALVPLYRPEVPAYAAVPPIALYMAQTALGTFHERRGEQRLLYNGNGAFPAAWGRVFGQHAELAWSGTVNPSFDGSLAGFQTGADIYGRESETGHRDRAGLFVAHARMDGDARGFALGSENLTVGDAELDGTGLGGYWTHIGPGGWYIDTVAMGLWFDGTARSDRGIGVDIEGTGVTLSLEGGRPITVTPNWMLEPQGQLIWQHLSLDDQRDLFSDVTFNTANGLAGRLGVRLQGNFQTGRRVLQPYAKANLWHNFDRSNDIIFGNDPITTKHEATSLELGGGIIAEISEDVSFYATADYTMNIGGEEREVIEANIGLRIKM